jgi:hypothetical protein
VFPDLRLIDFYKNFGLKFVLTLSFFSVMTAEQGPML